MPVVGIRSRRRRTDVDVVRGKAASMVGRVRSLGATPASVGAGPCAHHSELHQHGLLRGVGRVQGHRPEPVNLQAGPDAQRTGGQQICLVLPSNLNFGDDVAVLAPHRSTARWRRCRGRRTSSMKTPHPCIAQLTEGDAEFIVAEELCRSRLESQTCAPGFAL